MKRRWSGSTRQSLPTPQWERIHYLCCSRLWTWTTLWSWLTACWYAASYVQTVADLHKIMTDRISLLSNCVWKIYVWHGFFLLSVVGSTILRGFNTILGCMDTYTTCLQSFISLADLKPPTHPKGINDRHTSTCSQCQCEVLVCSLLLFFPLQLCALECVMHWLIVVVVHLDAIKEAQSARGEQLTAREHSYIRAVLAYASGSLLKATEEWCNMLIDYPLGMCNGVSNQSQ